MKFIDSYTPFASKLLFESKSKILFVESITTSRRIHLKECLEDDNKC